MESLSKRNITVDEVLWNLGVEPDENVPLSDYPELLRRAFEKIAENFG